MEYTKVLYVKCPCCRKTLDVSKERREQFNCYFCGAPLVFKKDTYLPKCEPVEIDGRNCV